MLVDNEGSFPGLEGELGFTLPECVPHTTIRTVVGFCLFFVYWRGHCLFVCFVLICRLTLNRWRELGK